MGRRLILALLALSAVFAMHGIQCLTAQDSGGAHTMTLASASTALAAPTPLSAGHAPADLDNGSGPTAGAAMGAVGHAADAPATALSGGSQGFPHSMAGHLWEVCLAVLAAGLALGLTVLVVRLARRAIEATAPWPGRRPGHLDHRWARPLRPPDLSQLCLLRI